MDRLACVQCRQCNHKGRPSVTRFSKYCNTNYVHRIEVKKRRLFSWFTEVKNKFFEKRAKYDMDGNLKDLNTKGFRKNWFLED